MLKLFGFLPLLGLPWLPFTLPGNVDSADYVAILDQNRIIGDYSPKEFENALLKDPNFLKTHLLLSHIGHFYLFKKK